MTSVPISFTNGTFGKLEVDTLNMVSIAQFPRQAFRN